MKTDQQSYNNTTNNTTNNNKSLFVQIETGSIEMTNQRKKKNKQNKYVQEVNEM